jgi:glyoxylase-like metal-dependent hydrolase (beta-lactamase superfamily II)
VLHGARPGTEEVSLEELEVEMELLGRLQPAADAVTPAIDLFPTYGPSPGHASLIVKAAKTVVIAGDAVLTRDYFDHNRIWEHSTDPEAAKESFRELREIADIIIPGHDNVLLIG